LKIFLKQEKKLDADTKERVTKAVEEILKDPYSGLNLKGDLREYWKKRVGKYRIIYKIDEAERRVIFFDVNLRKKVYNHVKRR
jgi:mRNA interferase RelE/StbE